MMKITDKTSVIDMYRNGLIDTRTANICRRKNIATVADLKNIKTQYGSIAKKLGPNSKAGQKLQAIVACAA